MMPNSACINIFLFSCTSFAERSSTLFRKNLSGIYGENCRVNENGLPIWNAEIEAEIHHFFLPIHFIIIVLAPISLIFPSKIGDFISEGNIANIRHCLLWVWIRCEGPLFLFWIRLFRRRRRRKEFSKIGTNLLDFLPLLLDGPLPPSEFCRGKYQTGRDPRFGKFVEE